MGEGSEWHVGEAAADLAHQAAQLGLDGVALPGGQVHLSILYPDVDGVERTLDDGNLGHDLFVDGHGRRGLVAVGRGLSGLLRRQRRDGFDLLAGEVSGLLSVAVGFGALIHDGVSLVGQTDGRKRRSAREAVDVPRLDVADVDS